MTSELAKTVGEVRRLTKELQELLGISNEELKERARELEAERVLARRKDRLLHCSGLEPKGPADLGGG